MLLVIVNLEGMDTFQVDQCDGLSLYLFYSQEDGLYVKNIKKTLMKTLMGPIRLRERLSIKSLEEVLVLGKLRSEC